MKTQGKRCSSLLTTIVIGLIVAILSTGLLYGVILRSPVSIPTVSLTNNPSPNTPITAISPSPATTTRNQGITSTTTVSQTPSSTQVQKQKIASIKITTSSSTSSRTSQTTNSNQVGSTEMTNNLFSPACGSYASADIIDRYNTNFTLTDSLGLREWRVGFVASDAVHGYYLQSFFQENPLPGTFEGASAATHAATLELWKNGALVEDVHVVASNAQGNSQLPGGLVPNRTIIAGDFVDFFLSQRFVQVFWYQSNSTIHNQQQIFSTNIQIPSNFVITDEYQIFLPVPGVSSFKFTNFSVSVSASQISNVFPHVPLTFTQSAPSCAEGSMLRTISNLCFDNPFLVLDSRGVGIGVSELMQSSDLG